MRNEIIKVGVIGVGHLGQHHAKHYASLPDADLVGIFDTDTSRASSIASQNKTNSFSKLSSLLSHVDAVSIVTPTQYHSDVAEICIKAGKHVFIEKPITKTLGEADHLLQLAIQNKTFIQVGHIERLNPALLALQPYNVNPKFIEIQRLAPYTIRGTDVPVVLDLMIHDIDILLSLVNSPVKTIRASGLSILTNSVDIAHARIRFNNGTVASILSSRIAKDKVRRVKVFQKNLYATIDLLLGLTEVYKIVDNPDNNQDAVMTVPFEYEGSERFIAYDKPPIPQTDALQMELENFIKSVQGKETPIVSGKAGRDALKVAIEIQNLIIQDIH
ncbi:MAG: Gfo/Idh/MocA family oxidoreductase [Candidatus Marinimicrobia bacterium]|jgi:predicted dehydrogenase|nr:Gfo/Idh/MocA family oxidoreductase [Candidatus Neomarinimicrobiota bacterium]MBT3838389.1 Gfo/Idh/MocA family oxidoreductase [Candidatus Neomarinimicrobiota bacterium]MBT3998694.1 Gfo/Idh/MocA family oxidoreductase [Candidatus Neomarinimicrobiota bacterium]MBT4283273.1 Gfo/Idh/MocA family oxidoreductase [Candidatus Neomarinimicrobiota bacterium]MBT4578414.1 Gfo/Idh/MocA family oxidoreductase [Candidatus Neomarinimicrobiota bacterium]